MQTNILQAFLNERLLEIGADDTRLEKLKAASAELSKQYAKEPNLALGPLLAAWDPDAGEDADLIKLGSVVQNHWPTFRSAFVDEPVTLYRAIVLQAVTEAMVSQISLAIAVHLLGENVLPHLKVGREQSVLSKVMECAKSIISARVGEIWATQVDARLPEKVEQPTSTAPKKIDIGTWTQVVAAAVGPHNRANTPALTTPNPQWANNGAAWSFDFTDRMAPILAEVHDKAVASAFSATSKTQKAIGETVTSTLNGFMDVIASRTEHLNRSSQLLWWRQSSYSSSADKPYRKLTGALAAFHMAVDLADLLPEVYPAAVESFLFEAVRSVAETQPRQGVTLGELVEELRKDAGVRSLSRLEDWTTMGQSRTLLLQALANACTSESAELPRMGIAVTAKLGLEDWAVWVLREVKALQALGSPTVMRQVEVTGE